MTSTLEIAQCFWTVFVTIPEKVAIKCFNRILIFIRETNDSHQKMRWESFEFEGFLILISQYNF